MNHTQRVLLLSAKVGAGHVRAAQAVERALAVRGVETCHLEAFRHLNRLFTYSFTTFYSNILYYSPALWRSMYESMERRAPQNRFQRFSEFFDSANAYGLKRALRAYDADAVLCTHYIPAEVAARMRRKGKLRARVYVALTDYDIHTMWIQSGVDGYFVATEEMAFALRTKGVGAAKVHVTGIPILDEFARTGESLVEVRRRLGLDPYRQTVLVHGGGFGLGSIDAMVRAMAEAAPEAQFLCIAGTNRKLYARLKHAANRYPGAILPFGYVSHMHDLMAASNLAVTKCGGLSTSECLATGTPMIITNPIPGQEERNSDYVLEVGAAVRAHSQTHLLYKLRTLLSDEGLLRTMTAAARHASKPRAAHDVAAVLATPPAAAQAAPLISHEAPATRA